MRVKLKSNGTPEGTEVVNAETGEPIEGVTHICMDSGLYGACLTIYTCIFDADVEMDAKIVNQPIVFAKP